MHLLPIVGAMIILGTTPAQPDNFLPGKVMVKFAAGSEADVAVASVSKTLPLDLVALAPHVQRLEEETNIPLAVSQLSSGNWVVLEIDVDRLNSRIVERLRNHRSVARVAVLEEGRKFIGYSPPRKVTVEFVPGSAEANTISEKLRNQGDKEFKGLVSTLEEKVASPLECEAASQEELLVQVDLKSLTLTLQERLDSLPSVEATQLNYVVKPL